MKTDTTPLSYRYHLPFGSDLQELLEQPYISTSILKKLLQRRGTFIPSQEKADMVAFLKLSLLRPEEFDYLMEIAISREERRKVRNDFDKCAAGNNITLSEALPEVEDLNLENFIDDKLPSCSLVSAPSVRQTSPDRYLISFELRRQNLASNWLKSEQIFSAEIEVRRDPNNGIVQTAAWHTSEESRIAARFVVRQLRNDMLKAGVITNEEPFTLRFNSFSNQERVAFLMKFTSAFEKEDFSFEKLTDLSLRLDESVECLDDRLTWMKGKVSKLNLSGKALEDTFFVTDIDSRKHLLMWRFECRFKVEDADGKVSITICFEFGGYGKTSNVLAPFQISCSSIRGRKYTGNFKKLEKRVVTALNSYQHEFSQKGMNTTEEENVIKPT